MQSWPQFTCHALENNERVKTPNPRRSLRYPFQAVHARVLLPSNINYYMSNYEASEIFFSLVTLNNLQHPNLPQLSFFYFNWESNDLKDNRLRSLSLVYGCWVRIFCLFVMNYCFSISVVDYEHPHSRTSVSRLPEIHQHWNAVTLSQDKKLKKSKIVTLQPHYNTNSVITRVRLGSHCSYFLCKRPSLKHYFVITLISCGPLNQCYDEVPVYIQWR